MAYLILGLVLFLGVHSVRIVADDWRGRTELGLKMQSASGIALDISGGYDGIGSSSYHAVIGRAMVRVPLN